MPFSIKTILRRLFYNNANKLPDEYKDDFYSEFTQANLANEKLIAKVLFFSLFALIFIDILFYRPYWNRSIGYRNLFISHIIMEIILAAYIFACKRIKKYSGIRKTSKENLLYTGIITISMAWCVFIAINAQLTHQQISAYYVCIFCISAFLELQPLQGFIIYAVNYSALIIGLIITQNDISLLSAHITNTSLFTIFAYVISRIKFNSYIYNFINRKIIIQKTYELEETQKNLKRLVKQQSEELLQEMAKRHDMEIDALIAEQKYNENQKVLNEKMKYEKLRTDFFANISHELRTPLNVIFSTNQMLELILKDLAPTDKYQKIPKYLKMMKQNCYRLVRLINNLIDITKIDAGYLEIFPEKLNIVKLVEDIILSIVEYAEHKNITLTFESEIEEKILLCDPDKIERIILNLLSNAIKFTSPGGRIIVKIFDKKNNVEISVKDTGIGIPKNKQEAIFERFVQVDASLSKEHEGSGIGLSMVKALVEMHNGTIRLVSEEGAGSEFIISLPYKAEVQFEEIEDDEYSEEVKVQRINIEFSDIYY